MTRRRRTTPPVPLGPSHRRLWRTLWRRCSCGLPAPCVDRRLEDARNRTLALRHPDPNTAREVRHAWHRAVADPGSYGTREVWDASDRAVPAPPGPVSGRPFPGFPVRRDGR